MDMRTAESHANGAGAFAGKVALVTGSTSGIGRAIALATASAAGESEGWRPLFDGIGSVDLEHDPAELEVPVRDVRVFAGYAGWAPGQLEAEVDAGAWYVVDALPDDTRSSRPDDLWSAVLRRQGGSLALVANFPSDPTSN